jgi:hypothetical protein
MIYILEDDLERVRQFLAASERIAPGVPVRVWRDAHKMIADRVDGLEQGSVFSLVLLEAGAVVASSPTSVLKVRVVPLCVCPRF